MDAFQFWLMKSLAEFAVGAGVFLIVFLICAIVMARDEAWKRKQDISKKGKN